MAQMALLASGYNSQLQNLLVFGKEVGKWILVMPPLRVQGPKQQGFRAQILNYYWWVLKLCYLGPWTLRVPVHSLILAPMFARTFGTTKGGALP